jgi:hypothetical protein
MMGAGTKRWKASMGIDATWVDEGHEQRQFVADTGRWIELLATTRWPGLSTSACLRFVDPWGDTVFNQKQIPSLMSELRDEIAAATDPDMRAHLEKVARLAEKAAGATHTYIKFTGD